MAATELPIVTLQNGMANERAALRFFAHVIGGVIWIPATYVVPGEVVNHAEAAPAVIHLGRFPGGVDETTGDVAEEMRRGGFILRTVERIADYKAAKLRGNLFNTLDALYPDSPARDAAMRTLQAEADAVFRAAGIVPAELDLGGFREGTIAGHPRAGASTRQSLTRAVTPETDFLDGEIVLLGRLHGVPAPATAAIQARMHRALAEGVTAGSLDDRDLRETLGVR